MECDVTMVLEDAGGGRTLVSMDLMVLDSLAKGIGGCTTLNTELDDDDDFPAA